MVFRVTCLIVKTFDLKAARAACISSVGIRNLVSVSWWTEKNQQNGCRGGVSLDLPCTKAYCLPTDAGNRLHMMCVVALLIRVTLITCYMSCN
jgi:hypothetical protein